MLTAELQDEVAHILGEQIDDIVPQSRHDDSYVNLKIAWQNENNCPEILGYKADLIERIRRRLQSQVCVLFHGKSDFIEEFEILQPDDSFTMFVYQQELERIKYIVRGYLRCRIQKVNLIFNTRLKSFVHTQ